jgi:hypothetical protein
MHGAHVRAGTGRGLARIATGACMAPHLAQKSASKEQTMPARGPIIPTAQRIQSQNQFRRGPRTHYESHHK